MTDQTISLNKESVNFKEMKRLAREYMDEMKENSPDYGAISMDLATASLNYLLEIGEVGHD